MQKVSTEGWVVLICTACESKAFLHNSIRECSEESTQYMTKKK